MKESIEKFFAELEQFGIKLGLEQTEKLFALLGHPEKRLKFIHIAGTNGKGSAGAMLSAALSAAGFRTGFYSSPHLIDIRERFRIDGRAVDLDEFGNLTERVREKVRELRRNGVQPTYFEVTTAMAAAYFAEKSADFAVWETGMGGRFDATNIVLPEVSVITGVGIDHTAHLGSKLAEIAFEKAGIIKPGVPVFCGRMAEQGAEVIRKAAAECGAECIFPVTENSLTEKLSSSLHGFQRDNAELAFSVLKYLEEQYGFDADDAAEAFLRVEWPARLHKINENLIIDGAHNPQAAEALVGTLLEKYPPHSFSVIFASFADKDSHKTLEKLLPAAREFIFPEFKYCRPMKPPAELISVAEQIGNVPARTASDIADALQSAGNNIGMRLVVGSLYLAGAALDLLDRKSEVLDIY